MAVAQQYTPPVPVQDFAEIYFRPNNDPVGYILPNGIRVNGLHFTYRKTGGNFYAPRVENEVGSTIRMTWNSQVFSGPAPDFWSQVNISVPAGGNIEPEFNNAIGWGACQTMLLHLFVNDVLEYTARWSGWTVGNSYYNAISVRFVD